MENQEYAGFWIRVAAALIDTVLILLIVVPLLTIIYGGSYWASTNLIEGFWDVMLNFVFPAVAAITFWVYRSATPGKILVRATIVDARTGGKPSLGQFIIRYLGYIPAMLPLMLGIIWVGIDQRKQGWHDKLAGTVVVRNKRP